MLARRNSSPMVPVFRPDDAFSQIRTELDQLLNRFFGNFPVLTEPAFSKVGSELKETDTEIVAKLDAPGFEPSDFEILVSGDVLSVRAERKEEGDGAIHRRMERTIRLGSPIVAEKVEANYRNGVLELKLPKAEVVKTHKIAVKSA